MARRRCLTLPTPGAGFHFYTVDTLLARYPEIEYIKWDANMPVLNHGSVHLDKDEQSHLSILYHRDLRMCADASVENILM